MKEDKKAEPGARKTEKPKTREKSAAKGKKAKTEPKPETKSENGIPFQKDENNVPGKTEINFPGQSASTKPDNSMSSIFMAGNVDETEKKIENPIAGEKNDDKPFEWKNNGHVEWRPPQEQEAHSPENQAEPVNGRQNETVSERQDSFSGEKESEQLEKCGEPEEQDEDKGIKGMFGKLRNRLMSYLD